MAFEGWSDDALRGFIVMAETMASGSLKVTYDKKIRDASTELQMRAHRAKLVASGSL
jgi:hypothetical protein